MLHQTNREKVGYSNAVDWWSLGVTAFKLLTGYRPFSEDNFASFVDMASTMPQEKVNARDVSPEYAILFNEVYYPSFLSSEARDLISKLLDVNDATRLGAGPNGLNNLRSHPFFANIDWDLLEQKHVVPPFKPSPVMLDDSPLYPSLDAMLRDLGKADWVSEVPSSDEQKYFSAW